MQVILRITVVSIHAPRAGGDYFTHVFRARLGIVSIHAPRAGGDG